MLWITDDMLCFRRRIIPTYFGIFFRIRTGSGKRDVSPHLIMGCGTPVEYHNPENHPVFVTKVRDITFLEVYDEVSTQLRQAFMFFLV